MLENMTDLTRNEYEFLAHWMLASGAKFYFGVYGGSSIVLESGRDEFYLVRADDSHYLDWYTLEHLRYR